jgi:hypothetical protein
MQTTKFDLTLEEPLLWHLKQYLLLFLWKRELTSPVFFHPLGTAHRPILISLPLLPLTMHGAVSTVFPVPVAAAP